MIYLIFPRTVEDIPLKWYGTRIHELPLEKKARLAKYVWNSVRTDISQLSRTLEIERETAERWIGKQGRD